jgi:anti-sigma regulatory factor (Ser/Thr protein kinase)
MFNFSDLLGLLKFFTDPETRSAISAISGIVSSQDNNDWKKNIKSKRNVFVGNEEYKVKLLLDDLLGQLSRLGTSKNLREDFQTVFSELVANAFEHGCKHSPKGKVKISCTYSKWFVHLEVQDNGHGFDLEHILKHSKTTRHGLYTIKKIVYRLSSNSKGNVLTAILIDNELGLETQIEKYEGHEVLMINVLFEYEWEMLIKDWKPLISQVKHAPQNLVLIDCSKIRWSSRGIIRFEGVAADFKTNLDKVYALVINKDASSRYDLSRLNDKKLMVFVDSPNFFVEDPWDENELLGIIAEGDVYNLAKKWLFRKYQRL